MVFPQPGRSLVTPASSLSPLLNASSNVHAVHSIERPSPVNDSETPTLRSNEPQP